MNRTMKPIDPARLLADAEPHLADCEILAARHPDTAADWVAVRDLAAAAPDLARRCIALEAERIARARGEGARIDGEPEGACPYPVESVEAGAWFDGWHDVARVDRLGRLLAAASRVLTLTGGVRACLNDALDALRAALGGPDLRALADLPICHDCPIGNRAADHPEHDLTRGPCPRSPLCAHECEREMAFYAAEEGP